MRPLLSFALAALAFLSSMCPAACGMGTCGDMAFRAANKAPFPSAYTLHAPILIKSDSNFTVANGVTGGSGTVSDPYVISGWDINASSVIGIDIERTSVCFDIRNCRVSWGGSLHSGIFLSTLSNGCVSNCTLENNFNGVELWAVFSCKIADNQITGNGWQGITGATSSQNTISRNSIQRNGRSGIDIRCSAGWNVITNNDIAMNTEYGIYHARTPYCSISHNSIHSNGKIGYFMDHVANSTVNFNNITNNGDAGLLIASGSDDTWKGNDNKISWNNITSNSGDGLKIQDGINNTLSYNNVSFNGGYAANITGFSNESRCYGNSFGGNRGSGAARDPSHVQARDDGNRNLWNLSAMGNYWSDWTGPDANADGIVDLPYLLDGNASSRDYYPVALPVEPPRVLHHISVVQLASSPFAIGQAVGFSVQAWADANETENITGKANITWELVGGIGNLSAAAGPSTRLTTSHSGMGVINVTCEFNGKSVSKEISFTVKTNGTSPQPPTPAGNDLTWIIVAIVVMAAAVCGAVAAVIIRRSKNKGGYPPPPPPQYPIQ